MQFQHLWWELMKKEFNLMSKEEREKKEKEEWDGVNWCKFVHSSQYYDKCSYKNFNKKWFEWIENDSFSSINPLFLIILLGYASWSLDVFKIIIWRWKSKSYDCFKTEGFIPRNYHYSQRINILSSFRVAMKI